MQLLKNRTWGREKTYKILIYTISFIATFLIYLRTMNPSSFGYDTTWFHIQVPQLAVGQTTGFPLAFLLGKLFTYLPFGTMAFRLNMFSVFFGAATVTVFVMVISNLIKKEYYIALVSTLFFCFFKVFWMQTNRFEVYTLHTFLIGLVILFGIYWTQTKQDKFLYLYYLFIGFSFTNHPLSAFLAPALILFPILIDYKSVFKLKKVLIIIAIIIAPLSLYLYIPIRSYQGYGEIKTAHQFFYYITGSQWKQQFGFKTFEVFKKQAIGYYNLIKKDLNFAATIVTITGFVMLAWKKWKFFILIISLIILNLIPIFLYENVPNDFYLVSIITFLLIPFACGLYYIKEGIMLAAKKIKGGYKIAFIIVFFIAILFFPVNAFATNFASVDKSKDTLIYDYWKTIESNLEDNSIIISSSKSTNVLSYILLYESKKNIKIERGLSYEETLETIKQNIDKTTIYFNQAYLPDLSTGFELEPVGYSIYWKDYKENLTTYKILGYKKYVDFEIPADLITFKYGEEKALTFKIINKNKTEAVNINSIELGLPKSLNLISMDENSSDIDVMPGISSGFYMWTKGPYAINPSGELKISLRVKAVLPDENKIMFRVTTNNFYEEAPEVLISIK